MLPAGRRSWRLADPLWSRWSVPQPAVRLESGRRPGSPRPGRPAAAGPRRARRCPLTRHRRRRDLHLGRPCASSIASSRPVSATTRRYAAVVTQNPGGTGSPTEISSPRLAPFPPPRSRSFRRRVSSGTTSLRGGVEEAAHVWLLSVLLCSPVVRFGGFSVHGRCLRPGVFLTASCSLPAIYDSGLSRIAPSLPLLNLRVRLRAFEKLNRRQAGFTTLVHDERYGLPDIGVCTRRFEGRYIWSGPAGSRPRSSAMKPFEDCPQVAGS